MRVYSVRVTGCSGEGCCRILPIVFAFQLLLTPFASYWLFHPVYVSYGFFDWYARVCVRVCACFANDSQVRNTESPIRNSAVGFEFRTLASFILIYFNIYLIFNYTRLMCQCSCNNNL